MPSPPSPRKSRKKPTSSYTNSLKHETVTIDAKTGSSSPAFPLASFFWPARRPTSQWIILPLVLMVVGLFRWCTGLWGYSGYQTPPMYGDYEAQRHWMEITTHLPMSQWYFYDLEYWGLDYPPITAYHSWMLGKIGYYIEPTWFALDSSRGAETQLLKVFMRATVLISEYLVYIPAVIMFNRRIAQQQGINKWDSAIALTAILMQPSIILVDHAHFQYNTVMLGLVLASFASLLSDRYVWTSIFFVAALCFKQMALYFAPAMFAYMLGISLLPRFRCFQLLRIAFTALVSLVFYLSPMVIGAIYYSWRKINPPLSTTDRQVNPLMARILPYIDPASVYHAPLLQITQIIHRCFPFARGIFEDKVANIWCVIHIIHKLNIYPTSTLQRVSLLATIVSILPACMTISLHPRKALLPWAMASCAWGFFLCSFQVHEKSVLLPLLPMTILLGGDGGLGIELRAWIGWANILGIWTMFPLLKRDELRIPYYILGSLWAYLLDLPPASLSIYAGSKSPDQHLSVLTKVLHLTFYVTMAIWHAFEAFVQPPRTKPDLWVVVNVLIGAAGFGICYLWCTWQLILRSGIVDEHLEFRKDQDNKGVENRVKAPLLPWPFGARSEVPASPSNSWSQKPKPKPNQDKTKKSESLVATAVEVPREGIPRKAGRPRKSPKS